MKPTPFHPTYAAASSSDMVLARRPILARAVRADVITPPHGPVFLWGEPMIGKTTLIREVLWSLEPDKFLIARLPTGLLAEDITGRESFARVLADQMMVQLESGEADARQISKARSFVDAINTCIVTDEREGRLFVLALEGLDGLPNGPGRVRVLENLEYLFAIHPRVALVLSSRLPQWALRAIRLPGSMQVHFVPPLENDDARNLLTAPVAGRFEYGHESLSRFLAAAGGRPFLLQIMGRNCKMLLDESGGTVVSQREAEQILSACWVAGERLFRPLTGCLEPSVQRALAAVALATTDAQPVAPLSHIASVAAQLGFVGDDKDLFQELGKLRVWRIVADAGSDTYYLTCGWFARYLRAGAAGIGVVA